MSIVLLFHYLFEHGVVDVRPIKITTSPGYKGGLIGYTRYKRDVNNYLTKEKDIVVTSLIDFFRLPNDFPKYHDAQAKANVLDKVKFLEDSLAADINSARFIPYIQLHEFEGLLFSAASGFDLLTDIPKASKTEIQRILKVYQNPELINDGVNTAPSKRLFNLIPGYQKTLHGPIMALENGISPVLEKCPRFNNWVNSILTKMKE